MGIFLIILISIKNFYLIEKQNKKILRKNGVPLDSGFVKKKNLLALLYLNWNDAWHFPTLVLEIRFCQLNFYQTFPNSFGGEN